ncbi:hypothetical protein [Aeromicrobium endophyticum]|uniref:DUF4190 domain-containing protein n=1 Tax=Aeromicrobium endophyticum TaxID=2292704 RepID=A0A371P340_9ACTN|nr:hypothetical protein [Aeromicrobium endophyticum]REK70364.1 hypothetical protein DX116_14570 [Aeromicrobium endophyticum]
MSGPAAPPAVSRKAVYSLACGALAFAAIYLDPFAGLLVALPCIASGVHARTEIAASKGRLTGDTVAVIGLMVGGGAIVTVVLSWALDLFG